MRRFLAISIADWNILKVHVSAKLGDNLAAVLTEYHQGKGKPSIKKQQEVAVELMKLIKTAVSASPI